ncbi:MAG: acylphosphatase [Gammaproteobacteria bacterium]|nr:acylphosphatase [Gammaproteobacteria bacterium]
MVAWRFVVTGKVQGVFFRASTAREATRLGLRGHALNRADGAVEVLAIGPETGVAKLHRWLQRGPPAARVENVQVMVQPDGDHASIAGFRTG